MLTTFKAQSFKSLVDVTVDLGVVNVFVGANGSGKSNLLEAVGILSAATSGRVNDEAHECSPQNSVNGYSNVAISRCYSRHTTR